MYTIILGHNTITYTLKRVRRKSVRLKIVSPELLEITAPLRFTREQAEQLLREKSHWIVKHTDRFSAIQAEASRHSVRSGHLLPYLGRLCTLDIRFDVRRPIVELHDKALTVRLPVECAKDYEPLATAVLKMWYTNQAKQELTAQTQYWSRIIAVSPKKITIRDPKTRWGSCSTAGNIMYNWRIIFAPPEVVNYVVVHELCHLIHPNHSAKYWSCVASFLPDYLSCRNWLKTEGRLLQHLLTLS